MRSHIARILLKCDRKKLNINFIGLSWSFVSVAFHPKPGCKEILLSSSHDETVKLWKMETGECFQTFQAFGVYAGMNIKKTKGISETQKTVLKALGSVY